MAEEQSKSASQAFDHSENLTGHVNMRRQDEQVSNPLLEAAYHSTQSKKALLRAFPIFEPLAAFFVLYLLLAVILQIPGWISLPLSLIGSFGWYVIYKLRRKS